MDTNELTDALRRETIAFRRAVSSVPITTPVSATPGWNVGDLIWHLAEVHYFWNAVVTQRATGWDQVARIDRVPDDQLLAAADQYAESLAATLATTDPATAVWTWSDQHDVAFVIRRMAQETAVHRWDAESAAGSALDIDPVLASDGIDEFLEHFLADVADGAQPVGGSVHIHCADTPGEWTIREGDDGYAVTREHAKGDCALRGAASDLLLALWRRIPPERIDIVGDEAVARRFLLATNLS